MAKVNVTITSLCWMENHLNWGEISRNTISYVPTQNTLIIGERGGINLSSLVRGYLTIADQLLKKPEEFIDKIKREFIAHET